MASSLEALKDTVTEIRNDLVCQICEIPARPGKRQWYHCLNHHQICSDCKEKNVSCAENCDEPISKRFCTQTEKLLSVKSLKFKCRNTKNGCRETFAESGLEDHETECIYRSVPCPKPGHPCKAKVTFQDVIQHYEKAHGEVFKQAELFKMNALEICHTDLLGKNSYNHPKKFVCNNQTFLFADKTLNKQFYYWVQMVGSPIEAKHFSYTLKLFGLTTEISFKGKVAAIDESFETLLKAGKCLAIPHENFVAYFVDEDCDVEDRKYEYSLEIRNLKEEAKDENYESGISDNDE